MGKPTLSPDKHYDAGLIVESWRLWEGLTSSIWPAPRRVCTWRLDADYFEIASESGFSTAVVIAQGAPMAVDALERLVGSGARSVVRLGTTGGLQSTQSVGDVVLPFSAIRFEGTSRHYLPIEVPACADYGLVEYLRQALEPTLAAQPCIVWTTDGRWTESDADVAEFSRLGVAAVDMESAALFSAGMRRGVPTASVSIVADLPIEHIGHEFKGLPSDETSWDRVLERSVMVLAAARTAMELHAASKPFRTRLEARS